MRVSRSVGTSLHEPLHILAESEMTFPSFRPSLSTTSPCPSTFHLSLPTYLTRHFNFFRIHLLFFTLTPLIFSGFFYAANGSSTANGNGSSTANTNGREAGLQKVTYMDSLFLCFSAMTYVLSNPVGVQPCWGHQLTTIG